ncbi:MAG: GntR family transcriptional regulator [Anaerolineales bacterium]
MAAEGPPMAEQAYNLVKQDILSCVLQPGQQIIQAQIAEKYNLGITPTREALKRLEQEGFVQSVPRFGYIVSPVTLSDLHELFELRMILETAAVRLAVERASDESLAEIVRMAGFRYVYKDRASYSAYLAENARFHTAIALAAGNQRLADAVGKVLDELTRVFHMALDLRDSAEEKARDHVNLAEAIAARDMDRAMHFIHEEITHSQRRVLEALGGRLGSWLTLKPRSTSW